MLVFNENIKLNCEREISNILLEFKARLNELFNIQKCVH